MDKKSLIISVEVYLEFRQPKTSESKFSNVKNFDKTTTAP